MPDGINSFVAACGSFSCICIAVGWILKIIKSLKQPEVDQNERINSLEEEISHIKKCLDNDNQRIRSMEHGSRINLEALQALLNHAIDGNNVEELKARSKDLNRYLYDKGFKEE